MGFIDDDFLIAGFIFGPPLISIVFGVVLLRFGRSAVERASGGIALAVPAIYLVVFVLWLREYASEPEYESKYYGDAVEVGFIVCLIVGLYAAVFGTALLIRRRGS